MHQLGDIDDQPPVEKLVLPGVTKLGGVRAAT
jgi:hypothetical protein